MDVSVDSTSPVPPYEQLRAQVARQVASGALPAGTRLATVRQLASDLGLAANTVAKAYRQLEADGVIATQGRRGTFVHSDAMAATPTAAIELAESFARDARRLGLTCTEATALVERSWSADPSSS
jgi:DNA-binding transcriptional regulator YhcF (GntR family)